MSENVHEPARGLYLVVNSANLRPELEPPPLDAWVNLTAELVRIARGPVSGQEYGEGLPRGFVEAQAGLAAVLDYLKDCDGLMSERAIQPLAGLLQAMFDLSAGRKPELFALRPAPHHPGTSRKRSHMIGLAARCMEDLVKSGMQRKAAGQEVVSALKRGRAIDYNETTWKTVAKWRDLCNVGPGADIAPEAIKKFNDPEVLAWESSPAARATCILTILSEASHRMLGE